VSARDTSPHPEGPRPEGQPPGGHPAAIGTLRALWALARPRGMLFVALLPMIGFAYAYWGLSLTFLGASRCDRVVSLLDGRVMSDTAVSR
jgi:hypothetical protein